MVEYFFLILAFFYVVLVCCYKEKLKMAIVILKASSNFLIEHMSTIFISLFVGLFWLFLMVFHLIGMVTSDLVSDNGRPIAYFHYFMIYWSNCFCDGWL